MDDSENLNFDFEDDDSENTSPVFAFFVREVAKHVLPPMMELYTQTVLSSPRAANRKTQKTMVSDCLYIIHSLAHGLSEMVDDGEDEVDE